MGFRASNHFVALAVCASLSACAMWKKDEVAPGSGSDVTVYNINQLTPAQYRVVKHIWTDDLRSNASVPTFASVDEGIAALKDQAAAAGGTALVNVMCLDATGEEAGRLLCYGDAIRLN